MPEGCPHPMRPTEEWLKKQILAYLLGEDNPASPAWQEGLAQHLRGNWLMVQEARAFLGQVTECECYRAGIRQGTEIERDGSKGAYIFDKHPSEGAKDR